MAFFRKSSALLRSALPCLRLREQSALMIPRKVDAESILGPFSPCFGARFMCSVPSTKLFVGGLAWGMDDNTLREAFVQYGEVVESKVVLDRDSGRSKGFGFVSFTCTDHADAARNGLDGKMLNGRTLRVNFAIEKQRGFGSFGSYGGGDSGSSYGSPSFNSGAPANDSSFAPSSSNQGNEFFSNNTFNQESLNSVGNTNSDGSSAGANDNFFGDDVFEDGADDTFGKDGDFAQGHK